VGSAIVLVTALEAGHLWGAGNPFTRPYRPTALEWLTVSLQANFRVACNAGALETECISADFQGHGTDEIWVLSSVRRDIPTSIWDQHVRTQRKLIQMTSDLQHLPTPKVKFLKQIGSGDFTELQ
jgi:hypothetical protein